MSVVHLREDKVAARTLRQRDIKGQHNDINNQIVDYLNRICDCGFTNANTLRLNYLAVGNKIIK